MTDAYQRLLTDLTEYLRYQKAAGRTTIEVDEPAAGRVPAEPAMPSAPPSAPDPAARLHAIADRIAACTGCPLCENRTRTVPGQGSPTPEVMFVGEGPGAEEDRQGLAFVGEAGALLTRMIQAMGLSRDEVFIANVVKCRPPGNRTPQPEEMQACLPFLREQIEVLQPKVIVALGATAVKGLMGDPRLSITRQRGVWMSFEGIDVMPTFHPAYLLRTPAAKRDVWQDLQAVLERLGRTPPNQRA